MICYGLLFNLLNYWLSIKIDLQWTSGKILPPATLLVNDGGNTVTPESIWSAVAPES